jgi:hypothetical protein
VEPVKDMFQANVKSIEAIHEFRLRLIVFQQHVNDAVMTMQDQVYQALDWIGNDRPRHWDKEVLKSYDGIASARAELETAKMRKEVAGHRPSLIEEKAVLREAKQRLTWCQKKVETVQRVSVNLRHEIDEFQGRMGHLQQLTEGELPKMIALLESMLNALEAYAEVQTKESDVED